MHARLAPLDAAAVPHMLGCLRICRFLLSRAELQHLAPPGVPRSLLPHSPVAHAPAPLILAPALPCIHAGENWVSADMVDCMLSYASTHLVDEVTDWHSVEGMDMLERIRAGGCWGRTE